MKDTKNFLEYIKSHYTLNGKETEKILQQQNFLLTTILNEAPVGFAVNTIDDGKAIFVTDRFEEIYGVKGEDINSVEEFFEKVYHDPVYREELKMKILEGIKSGDSSKMKWDDIHLTTSTGEEKVVRAMNIPIQEQNLMVSTVQDITDCINIQKELRKTTEILKSKLSEVEKLNNSMMGRELKMIEMKKQIEELEKRLAEK